MNLSPDSHGKIPLYITGHSLGGALASLFYSRLRKGKDLDDVCDVRDTYVYGCPGVGDTDFAMGYASYLPSSLSLHLVFQSVVMLVGIRVFLTIRWLLCGGL
jgi:predicted lipase